MSLLQRLAAVGIGRREEEEADAPHSPRPAPTPERLTGRPMPPDPRPEPVSDYAKRPAAQGLDQHGRQTPVHNREDEDQLDIPAFLRRQVK